MNERWQRRRRTMLASLRSFFNSEAFMPHGHCYLWRADILWLHVISDTLIALAYFMIPLSLIYLVRKRSDLAFNWIFVLFASFIVACGITHIFGVWTIWNADYALAGVIKLATALVSVSTAVILWPLMPKIIELPGVAQYKAMCDRLEQEIAERQKVQNELERRQNQLRLIINQLPVSIAYLDRDLNFQYCNATYAKWMKRRKDQIIGYHMKDILPEQNFQQTASSIVRALAGETVRVETQCPIQDRERHVTVLDIPDKDSEGLVKGVIRLITDISEHVEIENELKRAKDAADAANIAKSAFVANISHEIRTPLGAVVGFSEMLSTDGVSATERQKYLGGIKRNSELLLHIIDDVLDISKMEAGRIALDEQEFELQEVIYDAEHFLKHQAQAKGLDYAVHIDESVPQFITSDPFRLRQILLNMIGNAVKFSDHGRVELQIKAFAEQKKLTFQVNDQGIGIAEEHKDHLFESFYQADPSAKRRHGGTGLGLALSKRLAQMLGGDLELLRSEPGQGSSFGLTIQPKEMRGEYRSEKTNENAKPGAAVLFLPNGPHLQGAKILLAEDAPDNQFLISSYLMSAGAQVETVNNGKEAVEKLSDNDVDVVLMDLQMPVMSGFEALRELRKQQRHIPIIALTAHTMQEDKIQCLEAGFDNHIGKPINRNELIEKVSQYIHSVQTPMMH
jgi:PAS domain S-box-containing protein